MKKTNWTVREVLAWTAQYFFQQGVEHPRLEAELLLAHVLGQTRVELYINFDQPLQPNELAAYRELIKRRVEGYPLAYLTGQREFMSLTFEVNPAVLIPRPETETLVETAVELVRDAVRGYLATGGPVELPPIRIAEAGTGSGAIAVSLARFLPAAQVWATDISPAALAVAQRNAERHGVADRVRFYEGDLLGPLLEPNSFGQFALVVANLPYIPTPEIPRLAREVRCEPVLALDGGADGLDLYRRLVPQAARLLKSGGYLVMEIGFDQGNAAAALLAGEDWHPPRIKPDLAGRDRVVVVQKK